MALDQRHRVRRFFAHRHMASRDSRTRHHEQPKDVGTLWTMQRFDASARCALMAWNRSWELRVLVDGTPLLVERCASSSEAFGVAERWRERLVDDGWEQIVPRQNSTPAVG